MTNEELRSRLYDKICKEQEQYIAWLKTQPPEIILENAYEFTVRDYVLETMNGIELSPKEARALLKAKRPLAEIIEQFGTNDLGYRDVLTQTIKDSAAVLIKKEAAREVR